MYLFLNRALQSCEEKTNSAEKNHSFLFFPSDLRHPNILLLMAVCNSQDPSQQGLVLEPVERAFLGKLLHEEKTIFSEDTVLDLCRDIAAQCSLYITGDTYTVIWDPAVWY